MSAAQTYLPVLMERPTAKTDRARRELNPVRHPGRTVCQKEVSAASTTPPGWLRSERQESNLKQGWSREP
jgi:hypothetical protein